MNIKNSIIILFFALILCTIPIKDSYSQGPDNVVYFNETDAGSNSIPFGALVYFFDLRERESFIQLTHPAINPFSGENTGSPAVAHVQIYDVSNNCIENDFFDNYTVNDTHTYNMRDIQTNDGNPSGVVLPDGAYGIVTIFVGSITNIPRQSPFGNFRVVDNNGYEYRTNAQTSSTGFQSISIFNTPPFYSFNFNQEEGVTFSDVIGITTQMLFNPALSPVGQFTDSQDVANIFYPVDVDIVDNSENIFSCRNVIFSCVNKEHPRLEELLTNAGSANVASFEYGINEAIPHSKGGELLCPGNTINEGTVKLNPLLIPEDVIIRNSAKQFSGWPLPFFYGFIGLNNGDGRGSFDSFWVTNCSGSRSGCNLP